MWDKAAITTEATFSCMPYHILITAEWRKLFLTECLSPIKFEAITLFKPTIIIMITGIKPSLSLSGFRGRVVGMGTLDQWVWGSNPDTRLISKGCVEPLK